MKQIKMKKFLCVLLATALLCTTCTSCGSASGKKDQAFLQQVEQSITEAQPILNDCISIASNMASRTYGLVPGEDVSEYVELCRSNAELLDQKIGSLRKCMQETEQLSAPSTERGQAVYDAQQEYYTDALASLSVMYQTLSFYVNQYDEGTVLLDAIAGSQEDYQSYLYEVYQAALQVKEQYSALDTPSYMEEIWPLYSSSVNMMIKYLEAESWGTTGDVLRYYSASQIIQRMSIVASAYETTINDLLASEYIHCADTLDSNLKVLGEEIMTACSGGVLPQEGYMTKDPVVFLHYTMTDEIYPNLYPAANSIVNLMIYTDKGIGSVTVTAEIPGFTQVYEQKLTITPEITYLMIKPPILSEMPDLSSARDTQIIFKITDDITGEVLAQDSKPLKLYSIYDYRPYSDEFGIIQNDNVLAWMTPESDGVLAVRRNAVAWLENTFGSSNGILPGYQYSYGYGEGEEAYVTMIQVAAIQSAISAMGVRYNMGAYSLNATQRVLMPDAVLASQSGICIETAILMASVLQSADMHPMIVFTPGHAQVAVETWSGSGQYFLIETTKLPFDATVDDVNNLIAYYSSEDWANYLGQKQQQAQESGGMVYVVDCDLAKDLNIKGLAY